MYHSDSFRLRARRKVAGLSQHDLSRLVGRGRVEYISRLERGRRRPDTQTLLALELVFNEPASNIFGNLTENQRRRVLSRAMALAKQHRRTGQPADSARLKFLDALISRLSHDRLL